MRLFVDYTNWKGHRAWREIIPQSIDVGRVPIGEAAYEYTFVLHVAMIDKDGARRTLRLDHILGFSTNPNVLPQT